MGGVEVRRAQFERWVRQIYETQEEEVSCSDCFDRVSQYVDLVSAGGAAAGAMPCLKPDQQPCPVCCELPCLRQHLLQCRVCREEYETLRDLARRQAEGRAPSVADLLKSR